MNRACERLLLAASVAAGILVADAGAQSSGGPYRIERSVVAGGGASLGGGAFELSGTVGQGATAALSAAGFGLDGGFWRHAANDGSTDLIFANGFDS